MSLTEALDKRILYQEANVPSELIQGYQNASMSAVQSSSPEAISQTTFCSTTSDCNVNSTHLVHQLIELKTPSYYNSKTEKQSMVKDCKRTLFQSETDTEVCPTIPLITVEEFNKVPKYIIGRQTLETINALINTINQTLIAKYTILSLGKAGAQKKGEINQYLHYKKQEFDIQEQNGNFLALTIFSNRFLVIELHNINTCVYNVNYMCVFYINTIFISGGYLYFFTAEDYYRQTKTKIDKTKLNLITALRHCKRLREYRIKNELRYVIM